MEKTPHLRGCITTLKKVTGLESLKFEKNLHVFVLTEDCNSGYNQVTAMTMVPWES